MYRFSNNAVSTLAAGISETDEVVALTSGEGELFNVRRPEDTDDGSFQAVTLTHASLPGLYEVIGLTVRTTDDSFTAVRGLEGSGGSQVWPAGTKVSSRLTAGMLRQFVQTPKNPGGAYKLSDNSYSIVLSNNGERGAAAYGGGIFVANAVSRVSNSWVIGGYSVLQYAQFLGASEFMPCMATETVGGTHPVDLGVPSTWESTSYRRGSVVRPTIPDGNQYWIDIANISEDVAQTESEPDFSTGGDGDDMWVQTAMPVNISHLFTPSVSLVVSEVGFICEDVTATTKPTVSIGDESNPVRFANGMELSQIMGNGHVHRIPIATGGAPVRELSFRVDTSPTDGTFLGRFYFKGFFVEAPET